MATSPRLEELKTRFDENPRRYFAPLANEHRKLGDLERAIEICRSHLPAQPGHVSGHIVLAQALHESGRVDEARQEFEAALELDPENLIALRFMGDIARGHGDVASARAWYERVLDADPRNDEVSAFLRALNDEAHQSESFAPPAVATPDQRLTPVLTPQITEPVENTPADTPAPTSEVPEAESTVDFYYNTGVFETAGGSGAPADPPARTDEVPSAETKPDDGTEALVDGSLVSNIEGASGFDSASVERSAPGEDQGTDAGQPETAEVPHESGEPIAETLEIDPFDLVPSEPDTANGEPVTADAGGQTPSSDADGDEVLDFEKLWSRGDTASGFASSTAGDDPVVPDAANEPPEPDASPDASWKRSTATPASVEFSDLAAVPEDWFSEAAPEADQDEPPQGASHATEALDSSGADEIDAWFDEPAAGKHPDMPAGESSYVEEAAAPSHGEESTNKDVTSAETTPSWVAGGADSPPSAAEEKAPPAAGTSSSESTEAPYGAWGAETGGRVEEPAEQSGEPHGSGATPVGETPQPDADAADDAVETPEPAPMGAEEEEVVEPLSGAQMSSAEQAPQSERPEPEAPTAPETPEEVAATPFVTETLAELYLQQGFREEAIAIYRRLVDRSPFDQRLQEKLSALEAPAPTAASAETMLPVPSGPLAGVTVRALFSSLAHREPFSRGPGAGGSGSGVESAGHESPAGSRESISSVPLDFAPATREGASRDYEESNSALAQMFTAANPPSSDTAAAASLASAFEVGHGAPPPQGKPSHVSDREMSLDHLFRESGAGQEGTVSMDEFYSSGSKPDARQAPPEGTEADARDPEITQFSAWLEGLKKK